MQPTPRTTPKKCQLSSVGIAEQLESSCQALETSEKTMSDLVSVCVRVCVCACLCVRLYVYVSM